MNQKKPNQKQISKKSQAKLKNPKVIKSELDKLKESNHSRRTEITRLRRKLDGVHHVAKRLEVRNLLRKEQMQRDDTFKKILQEQFPHIFRKVKAISISRNYGYERLEDMKKRIEQHIYPEESKWKKHR